jgi:hypothetical protein
MRIVLATVLAMATAMAWADEPSAPEAKKETADRAKRVNGNQVYCTNVKVTGSRFAKEDCRTEGQLRDMEAQKASMRGEMDQKKLICSSAGACGAQ